MESSRKGPGRLSPFKGGKKKAGVTSTRTVTLAGSDPPPAKKGTSYEPCTSFIVEQEKKEGRDPQYEKRREGKHDFNFYFRGGGRPIDNTRGPAGKASRFLTFRKSNTEGKEKEADSCHRRDKGGEGGAESPEGSYKKTDLHLIGGCREKKTGTVVLLLGKKG